VANAKETAKFRGDVEGVRDQQQKRRKATDRRFTNIFRWEK